MEKSKAQDVQIYLENILQRIPGSIYWKDINGVYLGCNQMQADMAGLNLPEEMIGKTDYDLSWRDIADILRTTDKRIMETGVPEEVIETPILSDGTKLIMLTKKAPLYERSGKIIGIIGTSVDITARVEAEKREKDALAAAAASEARRQAEEQSKRAVMVLAGSITHDLRTPLMTLNLVNHRLGKLIPAPDPEQPPSKKETIHDIPQKISNIIAKMHEFIDHNLASLKHSTSDSLKEESLVTCQSYKGIRNAMDAYPFKPGEKELIVVDGSYYFDFLGNPILFLRILFNLLGNALYQIQKNGRGQIFISCGQEPDFNVIRFKDTGGGAAPDIVAHIFDGYKTTKAEGTGIGLAFCKLTMESFGGKMDCHSVEGDFIEFTLRFPKV